MDGARDRVRAGGLGISCGSGDGGTVKRSSSSMSEKWELGKFSKK